MWAGPAAFFFAICGWMVNGLEVPGARRCCADRAAAATASLVILGGGGSPPDAPAADTAAVPTDGGGTALYCCRPLRSRVQQHVTSAELSQTAFHLSELSTSWGRADRHGPQAWLETDLDCADGCPAGGVSAVLRHGAWPDVAPAWGVPLAEAGACWAGLCTL